MSQQSSASKGSSDLKQALPHRTSSMQEEPSMQKKIKPNDPSMDQLSQLLKWRTEMKIPGVPTDKSEYKDIQCSEIITEKLEKHGSNLQALFINIQWKLHHDDATGKTIEDFKRLEISDQVMNNGIIFVWSEKHILGELIDEMELKGFQYIENFMVTQLSADKALKIQNSGVTNSQDKVKKITDFFKRIAPQKNIWSDITPEAVVEQEKIPPNNNVVEIFANSEYPYFRKAKKILLMFRKFNKDAQLELRHQRTSDIYFDIFAEKNINKMSKKGMEFLYKMIETLLPKAHSQKDSPELKMMELFANPDSPPRKGWIRIIEEATQQ